MTGHVIMRVTRMISISMLFLGTAAWPFKLGVEQLPSSFFKALKRSDGSLLKVGLISNQTAVDQKGNRTVDLLQQSGVRILFLLAPEHGFDGKAPAAVPIKDSIDQQSGVPIKSIYGAGGDRTISGKRIKPELLEQVDALIYDIQDSGMRHYTYISTLLCALESAAQSNKPIFVLDRPNLLGGQMEGPLVEPECKSFASIAPIPLRYGMTIGELARYFNAAIIEKPAALTVLAMRRYERNKKAPFLAPFSPNIASEQSAYGYSFLGLMGEIQPFCVGVGTSNAFQVLLLPDSCHFPFFEWSKVKKLLQTYGIQSCNYSTFHKGNPYTGVKMRFPAMASFSSFSLLLDLLDFFTARGVPIIFSKYFDNAMGCTEIQKVYKQAFPIEPVKKKIADELAQFYERAQKSFLYKPYPRMCDHNGHSRK